MAEDLRHPRHALSWAFVAVPMDVLRKLLASCANALPDLGEVPAGSVEAGPFMQDLIAADIRAARMESGFTQGQLATRMKVSQTRVSMAESGAEKVSLAFVKRWLSACGLPEDWKPADPRSGAGSPSR
jgi:DNA-binding XRE family transcriptional regulator